MRRKRLKQENCLNLSKILIIEDEPNMVLGIRDSLEFEGYNVISAPDGEEGLNSRSLTIHSKIYEIKQGLT